MRGPSGIGKTTLLRAIAGLVDVSDGEVELFGGADDLARRRIGITLEQPRVWPWMRAHDAIVCIAGLSGVAISRADAEALLTELNMPDAGRVKASKLSQGMLRRVQLAGALAVGTDLLLLDEPTASLDADNSAIVWRALERRRDAGVALVVASHDDSWRGALDATAVELEA